MKWDSFIGNRRVVERLRSKLAEGRFPHALIFSGPEGVGKNTCALMVAKALNCPNAAPGDFCDECSTCRRIDAGTYSDVVSITVEEDAAQIKIGQVRRILGMLDLQPLEGRNRIYIIEPAELMNAEASNALLKGLEEPPENLFFILVTANAHELLVTVRSRCQVYNFTPLTLDEIRRNGVSDELQARWSRGSIGRARSLDLTRLKSERERMLDFAEVVLNATSAQFQDLIGVSAEVGRAKQEFEDRMAVFAVIIADLLYLKEGASGGIVNIDIIERLEVLAARAPVERLLATAEFLGVVETNLKNYVNRQLLSDVLALTANETAQDLTG